MKRHARSLAGLAPIALFTFIIAGGCSGGGADPPEPVSTAPAALGVCAGKSAGDSCADANPCDGEERCNAAGECVPGGPPILEDENDCTVDACSAAGGVTHTPVPALPATACLDRRRNVTGVCDGRGGCDTGFPYYFHRFPGGVVLIDARVFPVLPQIGEQIILTGNGGQVIPMLARQYYSDGYTLELHDVQGLDAVLAASLGGNAWGQVSVTTSNLSLAYTPAAVPANIGAPDFLKLLDQGKPSLAAGCAQIGPGRAVALGLAPNIDNAPQIQRCLDFAASLAPDATYHKTLEIPAGTWGIRSGLTLPGGVTIQGAGAAATTLKMTAKGSPAWPAVPPVPACQAAWNCAAGNHCPEPHTAAIHNVGHTWFQSAVDVRYCAGGAPPVIAPARPPDFGVGVVGLTVDCNAAALWTKNGVAVPEAAGEGAAGCLSFDNIAPLGSSAAILPNQRVGGLVIRDVHETRGSVDGMDLSFTGGVTDVLVQDSDFDGNGRLGLGVTGGGDDIRFVNSRLRWNGAGGLDLENLAGRLAPVRFFHFDNVKIVGIRSHEGHANCWDDVVNPCQPTWRVNPLNQPVFADVAVSVNFWLGDYVHTDVRFDNGTDVSDFNNFGLSWNTGQGWAGYYDGVTWDVAVHNTGNIGVVKGGFHSPGCDATDLCIPASDNNIAGRCRDSGKFCDMTPAAPRGTRVRISGSLVDTGGGAFGASNFPDIVVDGENGWEIGPLQITHTRLDWLNEDAIWLRGSVGFDIHDIDYRLTCPPETATCLWDEVNQACTGSCGCENAHLIFESPHVGPDKNCFSGPTHPTPLGPNCARKFCDRVGAGLVANCVPDPWLGVRTDVQP